MSLDLIIAMTHPFRRRVDNRERSSQKAYPQ
jgi:hypothetical protein